MDSTAAGFPFHAYFNVWHTGSGCPPAFAATPVLRISVSGMIQVALASSLTTVGPFDSASEAPCISGVLLFRAGGLCLAILRAHDVPCVASLLYPDC